MRKQAFCYFVLGASLSVLLQNLANRRSAVSSLRPIRRAGQGEVIDLAAWRAARDRGSFALQAE